MCVYVYVYVSVYVCLFLHVRVYTFHDLELSCLVRFSFNAMYSLVYVVLTLCPFCSLISFSGFIV